MLRKKNSTSYTQYKPRLYWIETYLQIDGVMRISLACMPNYGRNSNAKLVLWFINSDLGRNQSVGERISTTVSVQNDYML